MLTLPEIIGIVIFFIFIFCFLIICCTNDSYCYYENSERQQLIENKRNFHTRNTCETQV